MALLQNIKILTKRALGKNKFYCPVCNKSVYAFDQLSQNYLRQIIKYEYVHNIFKFETLNVLDYSCPKCGASDRNRIYALFLKDYLKDKEIKLLDFAPSYELSNFIKSFPNVHYRTADLSAKNVDDNIDIQKLDIYQDETFDFFICSHVLEHVADDMRALKELYRILNKSGAGIIMAPIQLEIQEDYEIFGQLDESERWKHFAQHDHFRIYSKSGFYNKLVKTGFTVMPLGKEYFGKRTFYKLGISQTSVLYIVYK